jgi:hypothetical protein
VTKTGDNSINETTSGNVSYEEVSDEELSSTSDEEDMESTLSLEDNSRVLNATNRLIAFNGTNDTTSGDTDPNLTPLPETVTVLDGPNGAKLYLVGTAHFSEKSQQDVSQVLTHFSFISSFH